MSEATPTFAIVGAVNHGKSSVVATLAEDDRVRISAMPGETIECQQFWLDDLFLFWDTPGFQNAIEACEELEPARTAVDPLQVFRAFIERHRGQSEFDAECRLLQPIVAGAGIIYVVDGSRKVVPFHLAEMEILRLTGRPRLAIINRTGNDDFIGVWKQKLGAHFNAVREFNAHQASFADRLELLDTLASIEQSWKRKLKQAVAVFVEAQQQRMEESAETIADFLIDALQYRETARLESDTPARLERQTEALRERYIQSISERESRAHRQLIALFRHHRVTVETANDLAFDEGLFSAITWQLFGLGQKQLVVAGALGGAAAGAALDLVTAGHTLLLGTAIGGAAGGAGAFWIGKKRPELNVKLLGPLEPGGVHAGIELASRRLVIGPCTAINFPWILLDRAIGTFFYLVNRSHARQDQTILRSTEIRQQMETAGITTTLWPTSTRKPCEALFAAIRKNKLTPEGREKLQRLIQTQLERVANAT